MRITPALAGGGKIIGWNPGDGQGLTVLIQIEQIAMCPDIGAVVRDKDRQVAEEFYLKSFGVGLDPLPAQMQQILLALDLVQKWRMRFGEGVQRGGVVIAQG